MIFSFMLQTLCKFAHFLKTAEHIVHSFYYPHPFNAVIDNVLVSDFHPDTV